MNQRYKHRWLHLPTYKTNENSSKYCCTVFWGIAQCPLASNLPISNDMLFGKNYLVFDAWPALKVCTMSSGTPCISTTVPYHSDILRTTYLIKLVKSFTDHQQWKKTDLMYRLSHLQLLQQMRLWESFNFLHLNSIVLDAMCFLAYFTFGNFLRQSYVWFIHGLHQVNMIK